MEREKAIELIQKLIRLQDSPNENEAALAAAKASELLAKYNLEMKDVSVNGFAEMVEIKADFSASSMPRWLELLAFRVSASCFCKIYYSYDVKWNKNLDKSSLRFRFNFYGRRSNAEVASYLFDQLINKLNSLSLEAAHDVKAQRPYVDGNFLRDYRTSYMLGAAVSISNKLSEMRKSYSEDVKAIVLIRDAEVEAAWEDKSAKMKKRKHGNSKINSSAYSRGVEDGKSIDIHNGLKETK